MSRKLIGILCLLFSSFLVAGPASAIDLPACGPNADGTNHFTLVAKDLIDFEGGNQPGQTVINLPGSTGDTGNLLVTSLTGRIKLGPNVRINGTAIAKTIEFPGNGTSVIANCVADIITGVPGVGSGASCFTPAGGFTAFLAAHPNCVDTAGSGPTFESLCGPPPVADPCVSSAPDLNVPPGATRNIPDASGRTCFKNVNLKDAAILNLTTAGPFVFGSLRVQTGARLNGVPGSTPPTTIVNMNGQIITEPGANITDVRLNVATTSANAVNIEKNSVLTNVVVDAPFGTCHPHTGTQLRACSELCCKFLDVQPITGECPDGNGVCKCDPGYHFEFGTVGVDSCDDAPTGLTCSQYRTCVPD